MCRDRRPSRISVGEAQWPHGTRRAHACAPKKANANYNLVASADGLPKGPRVECARAPVAQLDRVLVSEAKGHRFDSCRARQRKRTGRAIRPDRFSFRLMSYAVLLHHFLPESKDVRIVRVYGRAYPMGVGMAERRDSREVLDDPLALRADERLVNAEDVRIPVNVNHWLAKRERFLFQRGEEGIVAGLSPACWRLHGERPESVSFLPVGGPGGLKVRVRLRDDHHRSAAVARRQIERFAHPGNVGGIALFVLGVHLRSATQVVVAAADTERAQNAVP